MRALFVVPVHPVPNDPPRLLKRLERVLPDTFFFETPKEPFDDPVLFRRVRCDELLLQPIVPTGLPEPATLEDQAIVAAENRRPDGTERPEPREAGCFDRPLSLLCSTAERKLIADDFAIMAVDHRRKMRPAVLPTGDMRHIHRPPFIAATCPTGPASHTRAWGRDALMHEPPLLLQHAIDRLPIDDDPIPKLQQHPQSPIPKRGMDLNPIPQPLQPGWVGAPAPSCWDRGPMQARSADTEYLELRRSETPNTLVLTRRMSSGPKGRDSTPPVRCRCPRPDPQSSVSVS